MGLNPLENKNGHNQQLLVYIVQFLVALMVKILCVTPWNLCATLRNSYYTEVLKEGTKNHK
jgi:hypothetical protein